MEQKKSDAKIKLINRNFEKNENCYDALPTKALKRNLSFKQCFFTVTGCLLGSGLFTSPALVSKRTPNSFVALCVWSFAGFISLLGSLCFCELVSIVKKTGSTYIFVYEIYGKLVAFPLLMSIILFLIPFGYNVVLLTASTYAYAPFVEDHSSSHFYWITRMIPLAMLWVITVIGCLGTRDSTKFNMIINAIQIFSIISLAIAGIWYISKTGNVNNFRPAVMFNNTINGVLDDIPSFGAAIFNALFCFDGWYVIASFAEEIKNPKRNLPLIACSGLPAVTLLYAIINLSCLSMLTHQEMGATEVVFTKSFEKIGFASAKYAIPWFVFISSASTLVGSFYYQSRYIMSAAREGQLPKFLSLIHSEKNTPIPAILFMSLLISINLFLGFDIEATLQLYNVVVWIEYGIAFTTLLYLRYKLPNVRRTYRVWLLTAIFMVAISLFLTVLLMIRLPWSGVALLLIVVLSFPLYYLCIIKHYGNILKLDKLCTWLTKHTNLVVSDFVKTDWDKLEDKKSNSIDT